MPKIYKRDCDWCGDYYEGYGERFCGLECVGASKVKTTEPFQFEDTDGEVVVDLDRRVAYVSGRPNAVTPEELFDELDLDPDKYEMDGVGEAKTWSVAMKMRDGDEDKVVHVRNHGTRIKFRERIDESFEFRPVIVNVNTQIERSRSQPGDASLHYGDIHVPYHDERAWNIACQIADITNPHIVVDHGDTLDCENLSKYPKRPGRRHSLDDERQIAAGLFGDMTGITPNARHIWLEGNHEERIKRVVWSAAESNSALNDIFTLPEVQDALEWGSLLGLDSLGWEVVRYPQHELLYDRFICAHGSIVRKDSSLSARAQYEKYNKSGASGHTHRMGSYHHTNYANPRVWIEIGMLGQVRTDYVDHANWQQGLLVLSWSKDRKRFGVEQVEIIDGVAYFRGMRLEG